MAEQAQIKREQVAFGTVGGRYPGQLTLQA